MQFRRNNHSYLWNYFQLDLFRTVYQLVWAVWTQLVSHRSQISHGSGHCFFSRTSQSSQFSNSMPSSTINAASNQISQLVQLSWKKSPSLHLNRHYLLTPRMGRRRRRESSSSPPLPPGALASSTPHQHPRTHTYASHFLSTLTIAPLPSLLMTLLTFVH